MSPTAALHLLTVDDVADLLGCGRTLVYELLGRGEIGHMKIGRLTRIHPAQVEHFVRRRMGLESIEPPSRSADSTTTPGWLCANSSL